MNRRNHEQIFVVRDAFRFGIAPHRVTIPNGAKPSKQHEGIRALQEHS